MTRNEAKELLESFGNYGISFEMAEGFSMGYDYAIDTVDAVIKEKDNEIARLKKQLANNHHIECGCSFCKPMTGFIYGDPNVH